MPRIDRKLRAKLPKPTGLLPPPNTSASCRAAVEAATVEQLYAARERLKAMPEKTIARDHLQFAIDDQLKHRFREQLATGMNGIELEHWAEILDRKWVAWHVARNAPRAVRINAVPIGGSLCRG
jgi:hypothetical protein